MSQDLPLALAIVCPPDLQLDHSIPQWDGHRKGKVLVPGGCAVLCGAPQPGTVGLRAHGDLQPQTDVV